MELTTEQLTTIAGKLAGSDAMKTALGTSIASAVQDAVAKAVTGDALKGALTPALKPITDRIEAIEKAKPSDPAKPGDPKPGDPKPGDPKPGGELAQVLDLLKTQAEEIKSIKEARTAEQAAASKRSLIETTLRAKFPGITGDRLAAVSGRLAMLDVRDEAGVLAGVAAIKKEYEAFGYDTKAFGANAEGEGAKPSTPEDKAKQAEKDKLEQLKNTKPEGF